MEGYQPQVTGKILFGNHPGAVPGFIHGGWGKRDGRFLTPGGLSYLELCRVILSEVQPYMVPWFKKTNDTKERGVQVNSRVEKITQCSLGPKTLYYSQEEEEEGSPRGPRRPAPGGRAPSTPFNAPANGVRFSRPLSIYSPVFDRSRSALRSVSCCEDGGCDSVDAGEKKALGTDEDPSADAGHPPRQAFKGSNFQVSFTPRRAVQLITF